MLLYVCVIVKVCQSAGYEDWHDLGEEASLDFFDYVELQASDFVDSDIPEARVLYHYEPSIQDESFPEVEGFVENNNQNHEVSDRPHHDDQGVSVVAQEGNAEAQGYAEGKADTVDESSSLPSGNQQVEELALRTREALKLIRHPEDSGTGTGFRFTEEQLSQMTTVGKEGRTRRSRVPLVDGNKKLNKSYAATKADLSSTAFTVTAAAITQMMGVKPSRSKLLTEPRPSAKYNFNDVQPKY